MIQGKIGIGIITYKRPHFFKPCYESIPWDKVDAAVVVNDGPAYDFDKEEIKLNDKTEWIQHEKNMKLSKTKNDAIDYLFKQQCEHIFIIEDDTVIQDVDVFNKYINASNASGIKHLNYGPGSPFNREQDPSVQYDLHNRHLCKQDSKPAPRLVIEYKNNIKIALYEHTVAAFVYYHHDCIRDVGLFDEDFNQNAWEHVEHTYRIIKAGLHPPFWWFADIADSENLIRSQKGAIDESSIATEQDLPWEDQEWNHKVQAAGEMYRRKHGHLPNQPPVYTKEEVINILKELKA